MSFLYLLEDIRNPVLNFFFSLITMLGEETAFMAVGMIVFWCVDKYRGYFLLCIGFVGTVFNQFLKMLFRIPRPWVKDPNFTIVESAREAASGYSFPSGHTQTSVGLFGGIARTTKNKSIAIASIALCVLVPLSRMYLGVHTPADVGVSLAIALVLIFVGAPLFKKAESSPALMYSILGTLTALVVAYLCFVSFFPFPEEVFAEENVHNYVAATKNAYALLGCALGFLVVYPIDTHFIKFETRCVWWGQIIKAVGGLALVMSARVLFKAPLNAILPPDTWARTARYFLIVIVGGIVWPMTFKYFPKTGGKK